MTIYQWARPRDLAHFETFANYHATFGQRVEGLTTTPFSDRALDRGLTGVLVAAVRHRSMAAIANPAAHTVALGAGDVAALLDGIEARANRVTHDADAATGVRQRLQNRLESWQALRRTLASGRLGYQEGPDIVGLLRPPEEGSWGRWSTPRSLREVEAEVLLQLERAAPADVPPWIYQGGGGPE
ncbi:MAG: hypothetical protein ACYC1D_16080 [Acidimicrobiales bacterium]